MSIARFGVTKPVPVNLLMIAILFGGLVTGMSLRREFFPETDPDQALVTLPYPGAIPEEIEDTLAIKVEDKLAELDEIKEMRTTLSEGGGGITIEFREGIDVKQAMDEVERAVDSLLDLPEESEFIQTQLFEPRLPVIRVTVYGDVDEAVMKRAIRGVQDDLRTLPGMGEVLISGVRDYEIRIDVRREALLQHGLSLPQVAEAVSAWMRDVPGGTVRSSTGNIKVRTVGVAERDKAIRQIVVRSDPQGRALRLGDIADVSESFVDEQLIQRFNGMPAASLTVFKVGEQDIVKMAEMVRAYVLGRNGQPLETGLIERVIGSHRIDGWQLGVSSPRPIPPGLQVTTNSDLARFVEGRLNLLARNAGYGAILVFATLLLFLNWRVALWVGVGLLTALMGTLVFMDAANVTLNLLTMFGLITVLGLLVDDAIVVSENIQTRHDQGETALVAAVRGTEQVSWPVVATVLTTVVAFLPLTFVRGRIGDLLGALPMVVACALMMSLVESLLILPSHMGHSLAKRDKAHPGWLAQRLQRFEAWRDGLIFNKVVPAYAKVLTFMMRRRYLSVSVAIATLTISLGMLAGGRLVYNFLPKSDAEDVIVDVRLPIGSPIEATNEAVETIVRAARAEEEVKSVTAVVGQRDNIDTGATEAFAPHVAQMFIELKFVEERDRESSQVIDSIRQSIEGKLGQVERLRFTELSGGPAGAGISVRVRGEDQADVEQAVNKLKRALAGFEGVHDIADDNDLGQLELRIALRPGAAAQGFTTADVASQVRGYLYGIDAHVFADQREDIDVRVRLDEDTRRSLFAIENAWLISPSGKPVPLGEVAKINESSTYATIKRVNRQRAVTVTADTMTGISPETVVAQLPIDELRAEHPKLDIAFTGRQEQQKDAFESLPVGLLAAVVMIYVILAWLFSSYIQPFIILLAVPFAGIGVIWGHLLLGYELTFLSLIGSVALTGIVVNDSLILMKFFNEMRGEGMTVFDALVAAGRARLRAILLTTITTVLGLMPLILERSFQAKFLIPMAISIAMGLLATTVLILLVLPCFMMIFDDIKAVAHFLWYGRRRDDTVVTHITIPDS